MSKSIAPLAKTLGFRLFITDDREEFANAERFSQADIIIPKKPEDAIPELPVNANTFIVIATRGHRYDNVALEAAAATNARYVGLLGSKRKTILIYEDLLRGGMPLERVRDLRAPIGLDVGARTPEEIAVSVMSEILMFPARRHRSTHEARREAPATASWARSRPRKRRRWSRWRPRTRESNLMTNQAEDCSRTR